MFNRRKQQQRELASADTVVVSGNGLQNNSGGPVFVSHTDLRKATKQFDESECIGSGRHGMVYRAEFEGDDHVYAVKKIRCRNYGSLRTYVSKLSAISQMMKQHNNLAKVRGWSWESEGYFYLVSDYMERSSLDRYLRGPRHGAGGGGGIRPPPAERLDWRARYRIARGLANAICYLHEGQGSSVLLRNIIKPSKVLLDSDFTAKLGFIIDDDDDDDAAGGEGKWSKASDVYGFGVVALEIAHGGGCEEEGRDIATWVAELMNAEEGGSGTGILGAADPALGGDFDEAEMECLLMVGLRCAHPNPAHRPPISVAVKALQDSSSSVNVDDGRFQSAATYPPDTASEGAAPTPIVSVLIHDFKSGGNNFGVGAPPKRSAPRKTTIPTRITSVNFIPDDGAGN